MNTNFRTNNTNNDRSEMDNTKIRINYTNNTCIVSKFNYIYIGIVIISQVCRGCVV